MEELVDVFAQMRLLVVFQFFAQIVVDLDIHFYKVVLLYSVYELISILNRTKKKKIKNRRRIFIFQNYYNLCKIVDY